VCIFPENNEILSKTEETKTVATTEETQQAFGRNKRIMSSSNKSWQLDCFITKKMFKVGF
jgi:hypothetical protein